MILRGWELVGLAPVWAGKSETMVGSYGMAVLNKFCICLDGRTPWVRFLEGRPDAHPGARASRPHKSWQSLGNLLHPGRPVSTAPGLCFGPAHAVPAVRVAGCPIAGKLIGRNGSACGRDARAPGWTSLPSLLLLPGGALACRVPHRREPERHATGVHAGGTPALPGGAPPITLAARGGAPACRVPHCRATERHVTGVHAGGTPALPGGLPSHHSCCSRGRAGLPGAALQETERHATGAHAGETPALPGGPSSRHRSPPNSSCSWSGSVTGALQV